MKKEINPAVAIGALVLIIAAVGYFLFARTGGTSSGDSKSMPMPKAAADQMRQMMQQRQAGQFKQQN